MATAKEVAVDLAGLAFETQAKVALAVRVHGALLEAAVKRNASLPRSGPPGPRIITGNYVRSISRRFESRLSHAAVYIGTNAVQGRRLEFGFHGFDSLGRFYDQPPYPHFGPAIEEIRPAFEAALLAAGVPKR